MTDSCCAVQCTNMRGKCDEKIKFYRPCSKYFMTGAKSDVPLYIDSIPTVFAFVPVAGASRKKKSINRYERSQKRARNQDQKKFVGLEEEHSVPDSVEQIEFEIVADKVTQTEKVIRQALSNQKLRKINLCKKQVKQKNAQIKELQHYKEHIFSYENTRERDLKFLTGVANSQLLMWLLDVIKLNVSLLVQRFGYENHLFLVLMKLILGLINQDLAI